MTIKGKQSIATIAAACALTVTPALAQAPERGGTMVYAVSQGEPATFDCHAAGSVNVMFRFAAHYSTLLKIDADKYPQISGDLAESWTVSSDNLTYTFKLRPNAKFHDGTPLTSNDVKASLDRMRAPQQGVVSLRHPLLAVIASVEAPDSATTVVKLSKLPRDNAEPYPDCRTIVLMREGPQIGDCT